MKGNIDKLFVYGSLRRGFHNSAYKYISNHFKYIAEAKVRGTLFDLGDYPGAIPSGDNFITGELYELKKNNEFDWAMEQLDDYEGLHPEEGEKPLYRREIVDVFCQEKCVKAWIYWYNLEISGQPIKLIGNTFDYLTYKSQQ